MKRKRKEVSNNAKYLLILQAIISIIIWLMAIFAEKEKRPGLLLYGVVVSIPTIFLGLMKIVARFKAIFVDLFGVAYFAGAGLAAVTLSLTDWIELSEIETIRLDLGQYLF